MIKKIAIVWLLIIGSVFHSTASAATDADINKLTTYATVLGRAIACGMDTQNASRQVGSWMDLRFPPGSSDQQIYLPIFVAGVKHHAQQQASGNSPDSCSTVEREYYKMPWP